MTKSVANGVVGKVEFIQLMMEAESLSKKEAEKAYNAFKTAVINVKKENKALQLKGFLTSDVVFQAGGRETRNPETGELTGEVSKDKHKAKVKFGSEVTGVVAQPR